MPGPRSPWIWTQGSKAKNLATDIYSDWTTNTSAILQNSLGTQVDANIVVKWQQFRREMNFLVWKFHFEIATGALGAAGASIAVKLPTYNGVQLTIASAGNPSGTSVTNVARAFYGPGQWFQVGVGWKAIQWAYGVDFANNTWIRPYEVPGTILDTNMAAGSGLKAYDLRIPITEFT